MNSDCNNQLNSKQVEQEKEFNEMMEVFSPKNKYDCDAERDVQHTNESNKKPRKISSNLVTKGEGFSMWVIVVLLIVVCSVTMQRSMAEANSALSDRIGSLEYQAQALLASNNALAAKLDAYLNADEPINITVNVDGKSEDFIYDSDSGELVQTGQNEGFDTRPFLGVGFFNNDEEFDSPLGLKIDYVYEYSPAAFAGIRAGDVLLAIDGDRISTFDDLDAVISSHSADDTIRVQIATTSDGGVDVVELDITLTFRGNFALEDSE
jgi:membrane-associated protease RseP (regulator of RpoE activity)